MLLMLSLLVELFDGETLCPLARLYRKSAAKVKEIASVIEEGVSPLFDNFTALPGLRGRGADQKRHPIDIANAV